MDWTWLGYLALGVIALLASCVAAVVGTGGAIILLPILVAVLGVREAVPAYTLAQFIGNGTRVFLNARWVNLRAVGWFSFGAVPLAVAGAVLFTKTQDRVLIGILGTFLLAIVAWRRFRFDPGRQFPVQGLAPVGGVFALFSSLTGSGGPIVAPFFLACGLVRETFIGTEALAGALMHITKMGSYFALDAFPLRSAIVGLVLAPSMVAGAWLGKRVVARMSERAFVLAVEVLLIVMGLILLVRSLWPGTA